MVKVTIKNFKQETFEIAIDENRTVSDLKAELEKVTEKAMPADSQTLIYAGVIMENGLPLKHYQIDERKFIVVMMRKPVNMVAKSDEDASKRVDKEEDTVKGTTVNQPRSAAPGQSTSEKYVTSDSVSDPNEVEKAIQNIVEMGYPKEDVVRAFKASFNNPDRAVEYLVNGIPNEYLLGEPAPDMTALSDSDRRNMGSETPLSFLRNNPRFQQMKRLLRANPDMLNTLISQIGQTNPGLLQLITENQEEFVQLLNEEDAGNIATDSTDDEDDLDDLDVASRHPDSITVTVTQQEREAINRLKALGFPEELVIQAYFACDKDEQQAANFLLSQNDD